MIWGWGMWIQTAEQARQIRRDVALVKKLNITSRPVILKCCCCTLEHTSLSLYPTYSDLISMWWNSSIILFKILSKWTSVLAKAVYLELNLPSHSPKIINYETSMFGHLSNRQYRSVIFQGRETSRMSCVCCGFLPGTPPQCSGNEECCSYFGKQLDSVF